MTLEQKQKCYAEIEIESFIVNNFEEFDKLQDDECAWLGQQCVCHVGGKPDSYPCLVIIDSHDDLNGPWIMDYRFIYSK